MTFGSSFGRVFSPTFQPKSQAAAVSWWLAGGISSTDCVAAYQPKGAASYAASLDNLTGNATYDAVEGEAPGWDSTNGWKFTNGKYLKSGYSASGTPTMIARFDNVAVDSGYSCGFGYYGSGLFYLLPYYPASGYFGFVTEGTNDGTMTSGNIANAAGKLYKNGSYVKTITGTLSSSGEIHIGHLNGFEKSGQIYVQAFAIYSIQLTATNISDLKTAMAAL